MWLGWEVNNVNNSCYYSVNCNFSYIVSIEWWWCPEKLRYKVKRIHQTLLYLCIIKTLTQDPLDYRESAGPVLARQRLDSRSQPEQHHGLLLGKEQSVLWQDLQQRDSQDAAFESRSANVSLNRSSNSMYKHMSIFIIIMIVPQQYDWLGVYPFARARADPVRD